MDPVFQMDLKQIQEKEKNQKLFKIIFKTYEECLVPMKYKTRQVIQKHLHFDLA